MAPRAPRNVAPVFKVNLGTPPPGQPEKPKKKNGGRTDGTLPGSTVLPSGRPGLGRPKKGESFAELIAAEFERTLAEFEDDADGDSDDPSVKRAVARKFVRQALGGNLMAWIELMNRTEGKVADKTQMDVNHTVTVVPWDDENAPGLVYQRNPGHGEKPESAIPPDVALRDIPALPPPEDLGPSDGSDRTD